MVVAGQVGLDEGGILQALAKGGGKQVHETYKYNRKGLLIKKTTTSIEITAAHVIAVLVGAGILVYGPKLLEFLKSTGTGAPSGFFQAFLDPFRFFR